MKNIRIYLIIISLLGWLPIAALAQGVVFGPLTLNEQEIEAEYKIIGDYAVLGSGYNACIPQYSEGKVEIPATITVGGYEYQVNEISNVAFRLCTRITEVVVPANVYHIGNFAFQGCQSLTTVSLPSTLSTIGTGAFIDLANLCQIHLHAETPPQWLYNDVFKFHTGGIGDNAVYTYDNVYLCVPESEVETYSNKTYSNPTIGWTTPEGWGNFTNIGVTASENAEAYATYHNGILTFYYDTHRIDRQNKGLTTYGISPNEYVMGVPGWIAPIQGHANDITQVEFTTLFQFARPTTTANWFRGCANLNTIIGLERLRTDEVTNMSFMFYSCSGLDDDNLDLSHFNTANVTNMRAMFEECTGIHQPDLSHFDTHSCTSMESMFWGCTGLTSIDLSSFETTECNFNYMFHGCSNLEEVRIGSFGVEDTNICAGMFENCSNLTTLVIPSAYNKYNQAFKGCTKMRDVYCYKPEPFEVWQGRATDFDTNTPRNTRFHVLAATYDAWVAAYGEGSETPANVTFVGDLGTEENPYLLYSTADWMNVREMVNRDITVTAKMMNDFSVTTMMGTIEHPFKGTFDGNGHTLTVNYTITSETPSIEDVIPAPFPIIRNATIKNLHVDGTITVSSLRSAIGGLVGICAKSEGNETVTNTITNCHVSTQVYGKTTNLGGIAVAVYENVSTTISGCLFDGKLSVDHSFSTSYEEGIFASAIVFAVAAESNTYVVDCVERGIYENTNIRNFCDLGTAANNYCFTSGFDTNAKRAYSLTTDTEGLVLDFGTPQVTYDVSGITAYSTGMKIDDVFYAGTDELIFVTITAPGYENVGTPSINGGAELSAIDQIHYKVFLAPADAVISLSGMVFTTILLYDDARDNTLTIEKYIDQTYKVQLVGHTIAKAAQWNMLCLPFDLPNLNNTPLQGARLRELDTITFENKVAVFHFKYVTSISADKLYLVKVDNDIVDPIFNNVTIKRSLPPGMKKEVGELTQSGFVAKGNYNKVGLVDIDGDGDFYTAFYYDGTGLRRVLYNPHLNAFRGYFEVCISLDEVVAIVLDVEDGANSLAILDNRYSDVDDIFIYDGDWGEDDNWAKNTVPSLNSKVLVEGHAIIPNECVAQAGEIVIDEGSILIKDGGQLVHNNSDLQVTVEKDFAPYPSHLEKAGYYLITNPVVEALDPEYLGDMTMDYGTSTYDLYYFDQSEELEWRNYKNNHFDLENGIGYLYASSVNKEIMYSGKVNPANTAISIPVTYDPNVYFAGFNLVGNPFVCNAYLADGRDFYVLNDTGDELITATFDAIAPMQGLFVQSSADENSIGFTTTAPSKDHALNISVTQNHDSRGCSTGSLIDNARIRFGEGRGLEKLQLNPNHSKLYIPQKDKDYAVVNVTAQNEIPLNFEAQENGTYTLTISIPLNSKFLIINSLHLIDNLTGANIDLLQTPSYTFDSRTTDYASRFKLVFTTGNANDMNVDNNFAFISNGEIIVNGEGTIQVIDMLGRELFCRQVTSDFRLLSSVFPTGVYVLRLINGNDVRTQKIVVE